LVRAGINSVSINPDATVFARKLVASIEQRITLEKALGKVKLDPDWDIPDPDERVKVFFKVVLTLTLFSQFILVSESFLKLRGD